ncbi:TetR/AcrR family transcriptional regulator [Cellulomonas sp. PhB143]|uniref:TetR/AcrR family transcriptional regulator n=1 Tax=Cellulomonas sp. PhB143 TaxID=2485186 RepID=UPI0013151B0C|nr:TetR/AcrR family transcriptional regulator C-terminal domain-containing protein [Cellulomonas sp. PhB143]
MPDAVPHPSRDPARTLGLLWGVDARRPPRGPRPSRTPDEIAAAAVALADDGGLAALSMRRLAQALGLGTMSLYTYVQNKDDLVDLAVDRAFARTYPEGRAAGASWDERLRAVGRENWTLLLRHPWLLDVDLARPVLGPGETRKYDIELGAVDGVGLDDLAMDATVTLVVSTAASAARRSREALRVREASSQTDDAWWSSNEQVLRAVGRKATYPRAGRVGRAVGEAHVEAWSGSAELAFGLDRVVDGVAAMLERRADAHTAAGRAG